MTIERVRIVPAEISHVYALAANLRDFDRAEIEATGYEPRMGLRRMMRGSLCCRTLFFDGAIGAMWGISGTALADEGYPWLLTTAAIERRPVTYVRGARRELAAMLAVKPQLTGFVLASYARSIRFLEFLGFTIEQEEPLGPHAIPHRKFWMVR